MIPRKNGQNVNPPGFHAARWLCQTCLCNHFQVASRALWRHPLPLFAALTKPTFKPKRITVEARLDPSYQYEAVQAWRKKNHSTANCHWSFWVTDTKIWEPKAKTPLGYNPPGPEHETVWGFCIKNFPEALKRSWNVCLCSARVVCIKPSAQHFL